MTLHDYIQLLITQSAKYGKNIRVLIDGEEVRTPLYCRTIADESEYLELDAM